MNTKPGKNFIRTATLVLLISAILPVSVFSGFWLYNEFQQYRQQTEMLITEFTNRNRSNIRNEVDTVMSLIANEIELKKTEELANIKAQTLEAYRVAIYAMQQTKKYETGNSVQQAALDALKFSHSQLRPTHLVILDASGNKLLRLCDENTPHTFGEMKPAELDKELRTVLLNHALQKEGYADLPIPTHQTGKMLFQTFYFKRIKSPDWIFISFETPDTTYTELKSRLIRQIEVLRPTSSHYFFIADESGKLYLGPYSGENMFDFRDTQGEMLKPRLEDIQKTGGGFIEYVLHKQQAGYKGPKLSYIAYDRRLQWYVGTGMLFETLERALAENRRELEERIKYFVLEGVVLLAVLLIIIIAMERMMTRLFRQHLEKLTAMLGKAVAYSEQSDDTQFYFEDSRQLIRGVNRLVQTRVRSEEELRTSELKFRTLFENLRDGYAETDLQEKLVEANPSFCSMMGYLKGEVLTLSIDDLMSEKWGDVERAEVIPQVKEKGYSRIYEHQLIRKDGSVFPAEVQFYAIRDKNGSDVGFRCIVRDISQRKEAEKREFLQQKQLIQADKMVSLGILTSGVAHEINNPNQFIMTHNSLIRDTWRDATAILEQYAAANGEFLLNGLPYSVLKEKVPLFFKHIEEGTHRIQRIVGELKEFARDYPHDIVELIDINSIVASAVTLVDHLIKKSTHRFSISYGKELPQFWGHYQQLEQVIINLLQNACQSLLDMENQITLVTHYQHENNMLVVTITDEGTGIQERDLEHITDPFFTTRRENGGTGLGLSISDKIVREHHGTLLFSSRPGQGTTATLSIPVEKRGKPTEMNNKNE